MILEGRFRSFLPAALIAMLVFAWCAPVRAVNAQRKPAPAKKASAPKQPATPYGRGYQEGYTDGFAQGEADWSNNTRPDFRRSDKWQQRQDGSSAEHRLGYELGFELAYADGYYGRVRNSAVPRNAEVIAKAAALAEQRAKRERFDRDRQDRDRPSDRDRFDNDRGQREPNRQRPVAALNIPDGTELRIRLSSPISTKTGRVGDTFRATVVQPSTYESAIVEGHIATLNRSGRVTGKTEVGLAFDSVTTTDGRFARIDGELVQIYESESVKRVDEEGRVETGSRTRDTQVRGGVGAVAGAVLGGIVGGGKGALIGLVVGGAAGVGTVYVDGKKDLVLDPGTEMIVRVASSRER
ncbi:MAG TPA: hypothetical protein VLG74_02525 [Blastocatellia bacterium]|nr:hypothetical protein [Blastocatellia bacterium]